MLSSTIAHKLWIGMPVSSFKVNGVCSFLILVALVVPAIGDPATDYEQERIEFATSDGYEPYALQLLHEALLDEHFELAKDSDKSISEINEPLQKLADLYPLGIQVNYAIADFLDYVTSLEADGDVNPADFSGLAEIADAKRTKAKGILDSILSSGDGRTQETSYLVINIIEEYAVLDHFGLTIESQSLVESDGKSYDLISARNSDGSIYDFYFDISIFHKADE